MISGRGELTSEYSVNWVRVRVRVGVRVRVRVPVRVRVRVRVRVGVRVLVRVRVPVRVRVGVGVRPLVRKRATLIHHLFKISPRACLGQLRGRRVAGSIYSNRFSKYLGVADHESYGLNQITLA